MKRTHPYSSNGAVQGPICSAYTACRILCLTGPESSGKTTLAEALASHLGGRLVPEKARTYLDGKRGYEAADLIEIARLQVAAESDVLADTDGLVICDTDLTVIRIWWKERFGALPEELAALIQARTARAYLLARPDLPWAPDPLRESRGDRERLYALYSELLARDTMPYRVVEGTGSARLQSAVDAARELLPWLNASTD